MPLYDHECSCGMVFEDLAGMAEEVRPCPGCGAMARRIVSVSGCYLGNQDAAWLKTVQEVVDKQSTKPATREFLRNPTRQNWKDWMRAEGIRPMEGMEHRRPEAFDEAGHARKMLDIHRRRKRIEI